MEQILTNKARNLALQNDGRAAALLETAPAAAMDRRNQEFFIAGRALTWWLFGLLLLPFVWRSLQPPPGFQSVVCISRCSVGRR